MHILFHNSCPDGWCAAYIAQKRYPGATLVPLNHGLNEQQLDDLFKQVFQQDVLMLDYSLRTRELNDQMANVTKSFRILDHHKTAEAVLAGADYATFDMKRSGAGLAWDYLFGKDATDDAIFGFELNYPLQDGPENPHHRKPAPVVTMGIRSAGVMRPVRRPWWVNYTEDQDLWNWALPQSHKINAFLMVQPRTTADWDWITLLTEVDAIQQGAGVRQYIEYYTRCVVAEKQEGILNFNGRNYRTAVLNIPYAGVSEAGNALCKEGYEIGMAWFERGDGIIQFSLRSEGDIDVSAIAKANGGGGHQHAAGFQLSIDEGREFVDRVLGRALFLRTYVGRCIK